MAIIKCPECGHQVSDKAPVCPNCGVEIADKVTKCPDCGEVYFSADAMCPHCYRPTTKKTEPAPVVEQTPPSPIPPQPKEKPKFSSDPIQVPKKKKNSWVAYLVSFVIALLICGVCFYMYKNAQDNKEMQEYEFAMKSKDVLVLQSYLDTYKDAPAEHRDSISAHLEQIIQIDKDWTNAVVSNSKSILQDYMRKYPNSPHRAEAARKIDSLDWAQASSLNTIEAYKAYMTEHENGDHYDEAESSMKALKVKEITPEERAQIAQVFRRFVISINERDQASLVSTVTEELTLLDKQQATHSDVIEMMNKMYEKEGLTNLIWRLNKDYSISKREIGNDQYEFSVSFTGNKEEQYADPEHNKNSQYRMKAKVAPDGRISELKMNKIIE